MSGVFVGLVASAMVMSPSAGYAPAQFDYDKYKSVVLSRIDRSDSAKEIVARGLDQCKDQYPDLEGHAFWHCAGEVINNKCFSSDECWDRNAIMQVYGANEEKCKTMVTDNTDKLEMIACALGRPQATTP
ncbi:hypothetical protein OG203_38185 [Nocardia sp. NBC_01499]|uniref:hypothetical protein n=1 Tax=Nocardia sp. NBC_01499 TaxID=2903597 RepID=UPI00386414D8